MLPEPTEVLTSHQSTLLHQGVELFNQGKFFDSHEVLEELWMECSGERKKFLQGIIQVAVAFHHLRKSNFIGASRLLSAGIEKLSSFDSAQQLIDLPPLLAALSPLHVQLHRGEIVSPAWPHPRIACLVPNADSSS